MKLHFTSASYDAVKYNFRVTANESSFLNRNDRYKFAAAAKKYNSKNEFVAFCLANILEGNDYIGNMVVAGDHIFKAWQAKYERRSYQYIKDIKLLLDSGNTFDDIFIGTNIPRAVMIESLMAEEISLETVVMFNKLTNNIPAMTDSDSLLWPSVKSKILKYGSFLNIDRQILLSKTEKLLSETYK